MPVTPDAQLPIEPTLDRQRITGPGVDALENRKETGVPHDTEAEANNILRRRMRKGPDMPDTELAKRIVEECGSEWAIHTEAQKLLRKRIAAALSAERAEAFAQAIKLFDPRWDYFGGTVIEKLRSVAAGQGGENG